jgi:hypothetical protein
MFMNNNLVAKRRGSHTTKANLVEAIVARSAKMVDWKQCARSWVFSVSLHQKQHSPWSSNAARSSSLGRESQLWRARVEHVESAGRRKGQIRGSEDEQRELAVASRAVLGGKEGGRKAARGGRRGRSYSPPKQRPARARALPDAAGAVS